MVHIHKHKRKKYIYTYIDLHRFTHTMTHTRPRKLKYWRTWLHANKYRHTHTHTQTRTVTHIQRYARGLGRRYETGALRDVVSDVDICGGNTEPLAAGSNSLISILQASNTWKKTRSCVGNYRCSFRATCDKTRWNIVYPILVLPETVRICAIVC